MKIDTRVYIYDEDDHQAEGGGQSPYELEVDMELLEDGYEYALNLVTGEEVKMTDRQMDEARDKYMLLVDEYESAKADHYAEY